MCNANVGMVDAASEKHPGKFEVASRPAADHAAELAKHGLEHHGVVCVQDDRALWKHSHDMSQEEMDKGIEAVLGAMK